MTIEEKLTAIAANTPRVYEAGKAEGIAEGIEQGKQAEREAWWDAFTINRTRTDFNEACKGAWWDDVSYNPPYVLRPTNAYHMFMDSKIITRKIEVDLSNCTDATWMFRASKVRHIGVCDFRKAKSPLMHPFSFCQYLHTIDEVIVNEALAFSGVFAYAEKLVNMKVTGTIAQEGWNTKDCIDLSKESHESIFAALSTATTGLTVTLSKIAVNKAFATIEGAADGSTSAEWLALVATRSNWTIALA